MKVEPLIGSSRLGHADIHKFDDDVPQSWRQCNFMLNESML